ncbi:MAG: hypothetical protein HFG09_01790 [Oscillibacter sp.]|nr:hypothetical protein [Oscillibacter sp.]
MDVTQVSAAGAVPQQPAAPAQTAVRQESKTPSQDIRTLEEMIREAREKADARRDQFQRAKPKQRYGDAPIEAYARLARARNQAGVSAAAGFARRKIIQLQSAKRTDSENAQQIQAAINQLRKAVSRAGKKKQDLAREQVSEKRRVKMEKEKRLREAKRLRQELRRTQALRAIRESGYVREAEVDSRMQSYIAKTQMELREQAQKLSAQIPPSVEAAARQYAAASAAGAPVESAGGGEAAEVSVQA